MHKACAAAQMLGRNYDETGHSFVRNRPAAVCMRGAAQLCTRRAAQRCARTAPGRAPNAVGPTRDDSRAAAQLRRSLCRHLLSYIFSVQGIFSARLFSTAKERENSGREGDELTFSQFWAQERCLTYGCSCGSSLRCR